LDLQLREGDHRRRGGRQPSVKEELRNTQGYVIPPFKDVPKQNQRKFFASIRVYRIKLI
jgi:hypothetical protein